ncbi:MAG: type III-B CRISPR module RAMP protein Cmr1 [Methanobacteriota archaeon]|nr:MAG: type III-B CRISPR module RAMP protein Cmr1 [Euryarchaeota archaeon]
MHKFTIDFEIVTPMFIAGSNQKTAEFRLPSFKGSLRFWWRAVAFAKLKSLEQLKEKEDFIFGSTNNASRIHLNLESYRQGQTRVNFKNKGGLVYLGYGVIHYSGRPERKYISPNTIGRITIACRGLQQDQLNELQQALTAFALFGNMGSRARKGYGSINFRKISLDGKIFYSQPKAINSLEKKINEFCKSNNIGRLNSQPPFSAFSAFTRIDILENDTNALTLLNLVGEQMALYRSYGRNGKVMGKSAERNFKSDHDLIREIQKGQKPQVHPQRVIFGLPHNYFFGSDGFKVNVEPDSKEMTRRASPLFIKIHKLDNQLFVAVALVLRSQFLPQGVKIKISPKRMRTTKVPLRPDWEVLTEFIEGSNKQGSRFPRRKKVFPL